MLLNIITNFSKKLYIKRIQKRSTKIQPAFIDMKFIINNGLAQKEILVTKAMVGFKLGQFIFTKKLGRKIHKDIEELRETQKFFGMRRYRKKRQKEKEQKKITKGKKKGITQKPNNPRKQAQERWLH